MLGSNPQVQRLTNERLSALAFKVKAGTLEPHERKELANEYIKLAFHVARRECRDEPKRMDDFTSAALFGIVYALERATDRVKEYQEEEPEVKITDHLRKWVVSCMKKFIKDFRWRDHCIYIPQRTASKKRAAGEEISNVQTSSVDFTLYERINVSETGRRDSRIANRLAKPQNKIHIIKDMLERAAKDDIDRAIIRLRAKGHVDREIAEELKLSLSYIHLKRAAIERRYDELDADVPA